MGQILATTQFADPYSKTKLALLIIVLLESPRQSKELTEVFYSGQSGSEHISALGEPWYSQYTHSPHQAFFFFLIVFFVWLHRIISHIHHQPQFWKATRHIQEVLYFPLFPYFASQISVTEFFILSLNLGGTSMLTWFPVSVLCCPMQSLQAAAHGQKKWS